MDAKNKLFNSLSAFILTYSFILIVPRVSVFSSAPFLSHHYCFVESTKMLVGKTISYSKFILRGRLYIVRQQFNTMEDFCLSNNNMRSIVQCLKTYEHQFRQSGYNTMNLSRTRRLQISLSEVITDLDIAGCCGELIDCIIIDIPALNVQYSIPSDSSTTI